MNNLETRKRIYEILDKLGNGYDFKLSSKKYPSNNEFLEFVEILTNNNPYIELNPVKVDYVTKSENKEKDFAMYYQNINTIFFGLEFLKDIAENEENIMELFDTIYHEQEHHNQQECIKTPELIEDVNMQQIVNSALDDELSNAEIKELNAFANQHSLIGKMISRLKVRRLQFGAYLSQKCELDARSTGYNSTCETVKMMLEDPLCPEHIKEFLTYKFKAYKYNHAKEEERYEKSMETFKELDNKVKSVLMDAVNSNEPLDNSTYHHLLNGMLDYITKNMTLQENLEVAGWAIRHNYIQLLYKINLRNDMSAESEVLNKFINSLVSKKLITSENFNQICHFFSYFKNISNNQAVVYFIDYLAQIGCAEILLKNANFGINPSAYSQFISTDAISNSLNNYLNSIEQTKTITDYTLFVATHEKIKNILSYKFVRKATQTLLTPYLERFDKIDADKEIKIIENTIGKEETLSI